MKIQKRVWSKVISLIVRGKQLGNPSTIMLEPGVLFDLIELPEPLYGVSGLS